MEKKITKKHLLIGIPTFIVVIATIILCCLFIPKACQKKDDPVVDDNVILNVECINCTVDGQKELHNTVKRNTEVNLTFIADENCTLLTDITAMQGEKKLVKDIDYTYSNVTGEFKFIITADTNLGVDALNFNSTLTFRSPGTEQKVGFAVKEGGFGLVDWGDGTIDDKNEHTYAACPEGTVYNIKINDFTAWAFGLTDGKEYITEVNMPDSVRIVGIEDGSLGFRFCTALKTVHFTSNSCLTMIQKHAFGSCSSLMSFEFPAHVQIIAMDAFCDCSSLTSVHIPKEVYFMESGIFSGCSSLESITVDSENLNFDSRNNCNAIISSKAIPNPSSWGMKDIEKDALLTGCKNTIIPNTVKIIDDEAFRNCSSLTSISIPNSVISISDSAFSGCTSLQYNEKDNAKYLGNESNNYYALIKVKDTSITSYTIDDNCKVIADRAFYDCQSLSSITIPSSVTSIDNRAFEDCHSLQTVAFESDSQLTSIGGRAFRYCSSLSSISIPNRVTSIGMYAFEGCSSLTSISIPNSVTSIGGRAFDSIKADAIVDMSSVDHLISLNSDIFSTSSWSSYKFVGTIKVKSSLLETYKTADYWKNTASCFVGV